MLIALPAQEASEEVQRTQILSCGFKTWNKRLNISDPSSSSVNETTVPHLRDYPMFQ